MKAHVIVIFLFGILSCKERTSEMPTKGTAVVLVSETMTFLLQNEADQFHSLYPDASITIFPTTTREAIVDLLNGEVTGIVVDRPLNLEERQISSRAELQLEETSIARDGLALIVNKRNPLSVVSMEVVGGILRKSINDWKDIGITKWTGVIEVAMTGRNSGVFDLVHTYFFPSDSIIVPTFLAPQLSDVVAFVSNHPLGIGIASKAFMSRHADTSALKILEIIQKDSLSRIVAVKPTQETIYKHEYPLTYTLYMYTVAKKANAANGFSAFLMSPPGQKIIMDEGFVPEHIPFRTIQLTDQTP